MVTRASNGRTPGLAGTKSRSSATKPKRDLLRTTRSLFIGIGTKCIRRPALKLSMVILNTPLTCTNGLSHPTTPWNQLEPIISLASINPLDAPLSTTTTIPGHVAAAGILKNEATKKTQVSAATSTNDFRHKFTFN